MLQSGEGGKNEKFIVYPERRENINDTVRKNAKKKMKENEYDMPDDDNAVGENTNYNKKIESGESNGSESVGQERRVGLLEKHRAGTK